MKTCSTQQAAKSPNTRADIWLLPLAETSVRQLPMRVCICVWREARRRGQGAAIFPTDASSPSQRLDTSLCFPTSTAPPSCREHGRLSVIPKHGTIKAFWLLTRPGNMVDEWRAALREPRQGFCLVTLFSSSRWGIAQTGWLGVTPSRVHLLREPVIPFRVPVLERMTNTQ